MATEEKEEKTEVYQNKANDYAILLPEQMSEENGVTIENGKTRIGIIPVDGGIIELVYIVLQSVVKPGITGFFKIDLHIKCYIYLS